MPLSLMATAAFVALLWAGNFVLTQAALDAHMTPLLLIAARFITASGLVFITPRPVGVSWLALSGLGLGLGLGQFALATLAMHAGLSPALTSVVLQTQCLITMGLATVFLGERPTLRTLGGAAVALVGLGALVSFGSPCRLGLALAIGSAIGAAALNVVVKRLAHSAEPVRIAVWIAPFPVLPLLALSFIAEGSPVAILRHSDPVVATPAILFGGLISTVLCTALWTRLLRRAPASSVAPFTVLVPVFATALSVAIDQTPPEPASLLPVCAVLAGLVLAHGPMPARLSSTSSARVRVGA